MSTPSDKDPARERIEQDAAAWVLRRDRGLSPQEQDAFSEWLAADPRHGAQFARHGGHWQRLDALAEWRPEYSVRPNPDLLAPPWSARLRPYLPATLVLAAAAAVVVGWVSLRPSPRTETTSSPVVAVTATGGIAQRVLDDGTTVALNRGAAMQVEYTATERRVRLEKGEAHFAVVKNEARPFTVLVGGVAVRAIGTAFNVRIEPAAVEVLVTEGRVHLGAHETAQVARHGAAPAESARGALLEARQRAVVSLAEESAKPEIATLTLGEIERVLAWQHLVLDFTAARIDEIVREFNRRNVVQMRVVDAELGALRVSATLRSDNVEGFISLLEAGFGARAERRGDAEILLRKAP